MVAIQAEGDSPIFAAAKLFLQSNAFLAATMGTVPVNGYVAGYNPLSIAQWGIVTSWKRSPNLE